MNLTDEKMLEKEFQENISKNINIQKDILDILDL